MRELVSLDHMRHAVWVFLAIGTLAVAQDATTRPASAQEFTGYWRILNIADEKHGSSVKNEQTGYADPCQFLIHDPGGVWKNITISKLGGRDETLQSCPTRRAEVDVAAIGTQPHQSWTTKRNQNGLFLITDTRTRNAQIWKVDFVAADLQTAGRFGFDLKQGDLIVQLTKDLGNNNLVPVWPMVLRPMQD